MTPGMEVLKLSLGPATPSPPVSRSALCDAYWRAFLREFNPQGLREHLLAQDAARRAVQLIFDGQLCDTLQDQFADTLASANQTAEAGVFSQLLAQARLSVSDRYTALNRQNLDNADVLFRQLQQLQELQRNRTETQIRLTDRDPRFLSESACLTYLVRRYRLGEQPCSRCGQAGRGSWIASRQSWECGSCKTQIGVRVGTVMQRSKLQLRVWFAAIQTVLTNPDVAPGELSRRTGIHRAATMRHVVKKIRAAMIADNASALLAGLDEVFLACT